MTTEVTTSNTRTLRPRPNTTRGSIRQSLNLSSVSKALADVMHKDTKDTQGDKEKGSKKTKETASRRTSITPVSHDKPDALVGGRKSKSPSPEVKTITRSSRRLSTLPKVDELGTTSSEDRSSSSAVKQTIGRSTLRPRNSLTTASALPKYRPKSALIDPASGKKPPSPVRGGLRRKLSISDDDNKEEKGKPTLRLATLSAEKYNRAISPLPHRGALQVNLTSAFNVRPSTPEKRVKSSAPAPQVSPSRGGVTSSRMSPSKTRTLKSSKSPAAATAVSRPSSSASSSSSSQTPRTPTTPTMMQRLTNRSGGSLRMGHGPSPLGNSLPSRQDSPLAGVSARRKVQNSSPSPSRTPSASSTSSSLTPIILTEGDSIDSIEANDVEMMLSGIASPTEPTPALPRIRASLFRDDNPETPLRSTFLPSRSNMSYLSPAPPTAEDSPFLRLRPRLTAGVDRGSILSWEQLAQHSRSMGEDDIENMLSEIDAPFRPGAVSPSLTNLTDIPESPSLSAMPSPTGYGSISQVLLPDVTPSPAIHNMALRFDDFANDMPMGDTGTSTMLRLQLASAEHMAIERLSRIEALEAQLQNAKEARLQDAEDLARQISVLEEEVQGHLRPDDRLTQYAATLEEQLAHAQAAREQAVSEAVEQSRTQAEVCQTRALKVQQGKWEAVTAACDASASWRAVRDAAEGELELVRSNREMLTVLLAGLGHYCQGL